MANLHNPNLPVIIRSRMDPGYYICYKPDRNIKEVDLIYELLPNINKAHVFTYVNASKFINATQSHAELEIIVLKPNPEVN